MDCELIGTRLIVWQPEKGMEIYRSGFFGKPVGMPKPKPDQQFEVPLMLDLMEGVYLLQANRIRVIDTKTKKQVKRSEIEHLAETTYQDFASAYRVYKDLRDRGYVVTPGIKFGADFAVYERGPGIDHAPFIVSVKKKDESMGPFEIVRAGRLATTVRKRFTIGIAESHSSKVDYLSFSWFRA
ncbi:MAG: tRNA-intron lyase [archaeon]